MSSNIRFFNNAEPAAPAAGRTTVYVDNADKHLKQKDDAGIVIDLTEADIATDQEYFDKNAAKPVTSAQISGDARLQNYSVKNNSGAISQAVAIGASYNLLTPMLEANESTSGMAPAFFDINDILQTTYIKETPNKLLFPSNLYTYNNDYKVVQFRVINRIDHGAVGANQRTSLLIKLRRFIDNSIVSTKEFSFANKGARTNFQFTVEFLSFIGGETDPYVLDGMYVDFENLSTSATSVTIKETDVRLFLS